MATQTDIPMTPFATAIYAQSIAEALAEADAQYARTDDSEDFAAVVELRARAIDFGLTNPAALGRLAREARARVQARAQDGEDVFADIE